MLFQTLKNNVKEKILYFRKTPKCIPSGAQPLVFPSGMMLAVPPPLVGHVPQKPTLIVVPPPLEMVPAQPQRKKRKITQCAPQKRKRNAEPEVPRKRQKVKPSKTKRIPKGRMTYQSSSNSEGKKRVDRVEIPWKFILPKSLQKESVHVAVGVESRKTDFLN